MIHRHDQVIVFQIAGEQLSRVADDRDLARAQEFLHAGVGAFADMKTNRSGGFDFELIVQSRLIDQMLKYAVPRRRAADVTHTEKKDAFHVMLEMGIACGRSPPIIQAGNGGVVKFIYFA
jgi:hypothetical protein